MSLDSLNGVVGPIQYSSARSVRVREPEDPSKQHSAVYGSLAVYVDSLTESQAVIDAWPRIVAAAADVAQSVLEKHREANQEKQG